MIINAMTFEDFMEMSKSAKRVGIYQEIYNDLVTPISLYEILTNEFHEKGAILESGLSGNEIGKFSFLFFDSIAEFRSLNHSVSQTINGKTETFQKKPFDALRDLSSQLCFATQEDPNSFVSNAVGYISYDAIRLFEDIPDQHQHDDSIPDIVFNFYRTILKFNHAEQKLLITVIEDVTDDPKKVFHQTQEKISNLIHKIFASTTNHHHGVHTNHPINPSVKVDIDDAEFEKLVERAKQNIKKGDAFQIVLSRSFIESYSVPTFDIYRALRRTSPAPYMIYLPINNYVITGASPERMISVLKGEVTVNPIAGTRPRLDPKNDETVVKDLLNDEKELAEHMMLVDLARNDVGAVCEPGSVKVTELLKVKHFSHVSHITSVVTGHLRPGFDAFDALAAAFPAGTLSGAPKIRAMEIIDELETSRRGIYGGAICHLDCKGNLDSCIAIRMAVLKDGIAIVRAGAGIVFDSNPASEAQETRNKANAVLEAIGLAESGL